MRFPWFGRGRERPPVAHAPPHPGYPWPSFPRGRRPTDAEVAAILGPAYPTPAAPPVDAASRPAA